VLYLACILVHDCKLFISSGLSLLSINCHCEALWVYPKMRHSTSVHYYYCDHLKVVAQSLSWELFIALPLVVIVDGQIC